MTNVNKCDVHEKSVILFLNSSSGPYNMAFGSVSESDFKTAVTLRISELCCFICAFIAFPLEKVVLANQFHKPEKQLPLYVRASVPAWGWRRFLWMFSHVALCFTQKKSIRTTSLNVCRNELDDPVHASGTVACLVKPGRVYFVWSYHVYENLWRVLCTFDRNIY